MVTVSLKRFLLEDIRARQIFGKKELEIVCKQLAGVRLAQSEKNRLSRDIKPKFEFMKDVARFADEFTLVRNQDNKRLVAKAVDVILHDTLRDNMKAILLFGSLVDGTFTSRSDIDVCVLFREDLSLREATAFRIRISGQLSEKIDIQVFNTLPQKIKKEIARNHRVLYKKSDFDNVHFSVQYLKDEDYFLRFKKVFGVET